LEKNLYLVYQKKLKKENWTCRNWEERNILCKESYYNKNISYSYETVVHGVMEKETEGNGEEIISLFFPFFIAFSLFLNIK